jgi:hypothetical protein
MNPSKFMDGCEFDDALGLYSNTDHLEARLNSIVRYAPEDWLRS